MSHLLLMIVLATYGSANVTPIGTFPNRSECQLAADQAAVVHKPGSSPQISFVCVQKEGTR